MKMLMLVTKDEAIEEQRHGQLEPVAVRVDDVLGDHRHTAGRVRPSQHLAHRPPRQTAIQLKHSLRVG